MNKAQLVEKVAKETKLSRVDVELVLGSILGQVIHAIKLGTEVKLVGFGTFSMTRRKARKGRNPKTGTELDIPASKVPKFKPGKEFRKVLERA